MSIDQPALAVFDDKHQADVAVRELNRVSFLPEQIAVARQLTNEEKRETKEEPDGRLSGAAREKSAGRRLPLAITRDTCSHEGVNQGTVKTVP